MKIKKFLPLIVVLLVFVAAFTMMTVSASAEEATAAEELTPSEGLEYEYNYKYGYYTVKGIGDFTGTELVIPSTYEGVRVRRIAGMAFYGNTTITKVVIPDSVDTVGASIFQSCTSLREVTLSQNMTAIPNYMFAYCPNLGDIVIPESVTNIQPGAFRGSTFTSMTLPSKLERIAGNAFRGSRGLVDLVIPDTVTVLGDAAFQQVNGLKSVTVGSGITSLPTALFFNSRDLKTVVLPEGLTNIGSQCFEQCVKIANINFPSTLKTIKGRAFYDVRYVKSVVLPEGLESVGLNAFRMMQRLESIVLPPSVSTLSANNGIDCPAYVNTFYTGSKESWDANFASLKGIAVLKNAVRFYAEEQPMENAESYWHYVDGVPTVWEAYVEPVVPSDYTLSEDGTYYIVTGSTIELAGANVVIPATFKDLPVKTIAATAFAGNTTIQSIVVPAGVTVEDGAFAGCTALTAVYAEGEFTANVDATVYTYLATEPTEKGNFWHYVDGAVVVWPEYVEPSDYTLSDDGTYYIITGSTIELAGVTELVLPATFKDLPVKAIAANAFAGNTALKKLVIGANVTVENGAFDGSAVTEIYFEGAVADWNCLTTATVYFYSETQPEVEGNYWSYVNGEIVLWGPASGDDDAIELPPVGV